MPYDGGMAGNEVSREAAARLIQEHITRAYRELTGASRLAREHRLNFDFSVAYGMGGVFVGDRETREYVIYGDDDARSHDDGWQASSESC